jgi:NADPH:quinone reductase-like Zn-dependent oxidoreductase
MTAEPTPSPPDPTTPPTPFPRIACRWADCHAAGPERSDSPAAPEELRQIVQAALAEAVAGRLRPRIGQTFPLERAAEAHAAMEQRMTVGKTLLVVRPPARPA